MIFPAGERSQTGAGECVWRHMGNDLWFDNDTPALNALKALRGAPTSMGRVVKFPVELQAGSRPFLSYKFLDKYFDERGVAYG